MGTSMSNGLLLHGEASCVRGLGGNGGRNGLCVLCKLTDSFGWREVYAFMLACRLARLSAG